MIRTREEKESAVSLVPTSDITVSVISDLKGLVSVRATKSIIVIIIIRLSLHVNVRQTRDTGHGTRDGRTWQTSST